MQDLDAANNYKGLLLSPPPGTVLLTGRYVTIGGPLGDWVLAGLERTTGLHMFCGPHRHFWVRFPCRYRACTSRLWRGSALGSAP
jgi:hypothetical protein